MGSCSQYIIGGTPEAVGEKTNQISLVGVAVVHIPLDNICYSGGVERREA